MASVIVSLLLIISSVITDDIGVGITEVAINHIGNIALDILDPSTITVPSGHGAKYNIDFMYDEITFDYIRINHVSIVLNDNEQNINAKISNVSISAPETHFDIVNTTGFQSCYGVVPYVNFHNWDFDVIIDLDTYQTEPCELPIYFNESSVDYDDNDNPINFTVQMFPKLNPLCFGLQTAVRIALDWFYLDTLIPQVLDYAFEEILEFCINYTANPTYNNITLAELCYTNVSIQNDRLNVASDLMLNENIFNSSNSKLKNMSDEYGGQDMYHFGYEEGIKYQKQMELLWMAIIGSIIALLFLCICGICICCKIYTKIFVKPKKLN